MTGRALVLGGGGVTGIGWMTGLLAGLASHGVALADADTLIGTSAGSVVAVQLAAGRSLPDLYAVQLRPAEGELAARFGLRELLRLAPLVLRPGDGTARARRIGAAAKAAQPGPAEARVEVIAGRLRLEAWPDRDVRVTAVDADTGELVVLDPSGGSDVRRAVAASCAVPLVWPPVPLDGPGRGRLLVDGGVRSPANADLAVGAERVVVLAPIPRATSREHRLSAQLARTGARHTVVVVPDDAARRAIGRNVLDPARRAAAARAGFAQAQAEVDRVRRVWEG